MTESSKSQKTKSHTLAKIALPLIIGTIAFFLVVGPRALEPENIAWLSKGDPSAHYLGWQYFRYSDWKFPIGLNPDYGLELGSSIIFCDANPLFAFLFKPFSQWLPDAFQYFGIWLLACFILQAWFSQKLMSLITDDLALGALGASILVFSPPMMWRLYGHLSLVGHFLIVAALYFHLKPMPFQRTRTWAVLQGTTALVHGYLLAMTLSIWIADLCTKLAKKQISPRAAALEFVSTMLIVGIICWQAGYFIINDGVSSDGFGLYRMNLLSLIDSSGWSYLLKDIPEAAGDYEGFNYLGLGVIFLLICALISILQNPSGIIQICKSHYILGLLLAGLTTFAISNDIGFGLTNFKYTLPKNIIDIANIFRASGRMFWPVFYIIVFAGIYLITRRYQRRAALSLLGFALIVQVADLHAAWGGIRRNLMVTPSSTWSSALTDQFWDAAAAKYTKVRWISPKTYDERRQAAAAYAGAHRLPTDAAYLARIGNSALNLAEKKARLSLRSGQYESDSLYILSEDSAFQAAMNLNSSSNLLARIDNLFVVAPNWKQCTNCPPIEGETTFSDLLNRLPPVSFGERLPMNQNGSGLPYLAGGWGQAESWGTWSIDDSAIIILPITGNRPDTIVIESKPFIHRSHPEQDIEIIINDVSVFKFSLSAESSGVLEIKIPQSALDVESFDNKLKIDFRFPDNVSPNALGINNDTRQLALRLVSITVR